MQSLESIDTVASALRARFGDPPSGVIVLGTGLGGLFGRIEGESVAYSEVGLPTTSVSGHAGRLAVGTMGGAHVAMMAGRLHLYEGHDADRAVGWLRAMRRWGVQRALLTSAVGSVRPDLQPGTILRVTDHINLMGKNPLVGPPLSELGPRFPDLSTAYSPRLAKLTIAAAAAQGLEIDSGIYAALLGPSFETPAEIRMLRILGADVVGMSVVPEVIAAAQCGIELLVLTVVSNHGTGLSDAPVSHDEVGAVVEEATHRLGPLIEAVVADW